MAGVEPTVDTKELSVPSAAIKKLGIEKSEA